MKYTVEEFKKEFNLVGDLLTGALLDFYESLPHANRSSFLHPILLLKITEDPDYELWERHYQWRQIKKGSKEVPFFEFPHLFISSKGRVYNSRSGKITRGYSKGGKGNYLIYHDVPSDAHFRVHRAVACMFVGNYSGTPFTRLLVNHKDLDKQGNSFDNLEWCTNKENVNHALEAGVVFGEEAVIYLCTVTKGNKYLEEQFIVSGERDCKLYRMSNAYLAARGSIKTANRCSIRIITKEEIDETLLIKNKPKAFRRWLKRPAK